MRAQIHSLLAGSRVNGPGNRLVLWFQGCNLGCEGCWNPETHTKQSGTEYKIWMLMDWIVAATERNPSIEGITLSGGEPMQQAPAVMELLIPLRKHFPNLSIGMFSGYSERELDHGKYETEVDAAYAHEATCSGCRSHLWSAIRSRLDWAVLGRYNQHQPNASPLTTSGNQQLHIYSSRYTASDFAPQSVEVQIGTDGLVQLTGFPTLGNII